MTRLGVSGALTIAVVFALASCTLPGIGDVVTGSGNVVTEERTVSGITAVELAGAGELIIDQTGSEALTVEADDNLLPVIETEVRDGTLHIGYAPGAVVGTATRLRYTLNVRELERLIISGAGSATINNLAGERFTLNSSGAGSVSASGTVTEQRVTISGAGSYDGADLASQIATVTVSGLGNVVVQVSDELNAVISGAGNIEYIGDPLIDEQVSGAGRIVERAR